jgi:N-sulfoglucosamine sulfohydrolase
MQITSTFLTGALVLFGVSNAVQLHAGNKGQQPNILLFIGDDMTWRDCEPYGNKEVRTPNMQRLANEGICLDNMYTSTPMCAPTRQQLYTGLYPVRNGAYPNHSRLWEGVKTFATYFNDLGYRTALIGKKHYGPQEAYPLHYFGGRHHDDGKGRDIEMEKVETLIVDKHEKPYFLVVAQNQPHEPWNRGQQEIYKNRDLTVPPYLVDVPRTKHELSRYYAEITYADSLLGVCLDYVDQSGEADNTIVIFTSEQGSSLPFGKWTCYDLGLKTAFIVRWPGMVKPSTRTSAFTQYVDVVPTLLELAGEKPSKYKTGSTDTKGKTGFDGISFADVLLKGKTKHRDYVFGVHTTRGIYFGPEAYAIRSVRDKRFKLIWNINHENTFSNLVTNARNSILNDWEASADEKDRQRALFYRNRPEFELYDMINDPFELENLADNPDYSGEKAAYFRVLQRWMQQQGDKGNETEMAAKERQRDVE